MLYCTYMLYYTYIGARMSKQGELIEHLKQDIRGRFIMEIKVWRVDDCRYSYGLKYSLIFLERKTDRRVLMDNHYSKQPHVHLDDVELSYDFMGVETLFR